MPSKVKRDILPQSPAIGNRHNMGMAILDKLSMTDIDVVGIRKRMFPTADPILDDVSDIIQMDHSVKLDICRNRQFDNINSWR